jgi:lysyl endopeptidase
MRKFYWLLLVLQGFTHLAFSQLSKGGYPFSFHNKIVEDIPVLMLDGFDVNQMLKEDEQKNKDKVGPYRFGRNFEVNYHPGNSGIWLNLDNGDRIWLFAVKSSGAYSLNFIFNDFFIPTGASLFIYNDSKTHIAGAFGYHNNNSNRIFATDLIKGDCVFFEYYEPAAIKDQGKLLLSNITHAYRDVINDFKKNFGSSGTCNINVNCTLGLDWESQKRSVVMLLVGGNGFCTGALINNTSEDGTPYVLTADHCGNTGIDSWVFRFNWEAPNCPNPITSPPFQSLNGAVLRANNHDSDFMLLELNEPVPLNFNPYYSGWSRSDNNIPSAISIHHPNGDIKKISETRKNLKKDDINSIKTWVIESWDEGTTEPGSSGSPLFDEDKRIIGQLYGGFAACDNSLEDYYGRLAISWEGPSKQERLKDWLDPSNSGTTAINGFDPALNLVNNDAGIASILFPEANSIICTNSISPKVVLRNFGKDTLSYVNIKYQFNNDEIFTKSWTGSLATGFNQLVELDEINLDTGTYSLKVFTENPNNLEDQNQQNNTKSINFELILTPQGKLVESKILENFENLIFPPKNWSKKADQEFGWQLITGISGLGTGNACIYVNNFDNTQINQRSMLITETYNLIELAPPFYLNFDLAYARYSSNNIDSLVVSFSEDCGASWKRLYAKGGLELSTIGNINFTQPFIPNASQWKTETVNLSDYTNSKQIIINFESVNGYGNNLYLDNITLSDPTKVIPLFATDKILVFPNPFKDVLNLYSNHDHLIEIIIFDYSGKKVFATTLVEITDFVSLDRLSVMPSGIYIAEVKGKNSVNRIKLIKAE